MRKLLLQDTINSILEEVTWLQAEKARGSGGTASRDGGLLTGPCLIGNGENCFFGRVEVPGTRLLKGTSAGWMFLNSCRRFVQDTFLFWNAAVCPLLEVILRSQGRSNVPFYTAPPRPLWLTL